MTEYNPNRAYLSQGGRVTVEARMDARIRATSIAVLTLVTGCAHSHRGDLKTNPPNAAGAAVRFGSISPLPATFKCEVSGGMSRWVIELSEDGSFEFSLEMCVGKGAWWRGRFNVDRDLLHLDPNDTVAAGLDEFMAYRVVEDGRALLAIGTDDSVRTSKWVFLRVGARFAE